MKPYLCLLLALGLVVGRGSVLGETPQPAGRPDVTRRIGLRWFTQDEASADLQQRVLRAFKKEIERAGFTVADDGWTQFILVVRQVPTASERLVAISVLQAQSLPEAVVDFNVEHETYYTRQLTGKETLDPQGKFIRRQMTEEFMREHRHVVEADLVVVPESEVEMACARIFKEFLTVYYPKGNGKSRVRPDLQK